MKNSTRVEMILCLTIVLAFSLSVAFAGDEKTNVTKNITNATKNLTNMTKNLTNATNPFANVKGIVKSNLSYLNNTSLPPNEVQLASNRPPPKPPLGGGGAGKGGGVTASIKLPPKPPTPPGNGGTGRAGGVTG